MRIVSLLDPDASDAGGSTPSLAAAVDRYMDGPQPIFARLPISYRLVPLGMRMLGLRAVALLRPVAADAFPTWPWETRVDEHLVGRNVRLSYGGRSSALIVTHDIDSGPEIHDVERVRLIERPLGVPSSFGFVPGQSWPTEDLARALVADGCEVYWHDIDHDGRLPYLGIEGIRAAFDRVIERSPWAQELMKTFRAGQLLVSRDLMQVVSERFVVDMSIPDTEHHGPYGGAAGCGTVFPFRLDGMLELPLTMPQEVYLRHVYGLSAEDALGVWLRKLGYIRSRGGVAVFNIHPIWIDRANLDMQEAFRKFLEAAATMDDVFITTPEALASRITRHDAGAAPVAALAESGGTIGGLPIRTGLPDSQQ